MAANLSKIIQVTCKVCDKPFIEANRAELGDEYLITGKCGHFIFEPILKSDEYTIISSDGKIPRPYQIEGIKFAEQSNVRCLIADEQGLGKTIQALGVLKLHPDLAPALVITKTTLTHQWYKEVERWCGKNTFSMQVIKSGKEKALPGFDVYVCSYDLLKTDGIFSMLIFPIKTIIIDECQAIKNHLSGRAKAVQDIARTAEHIIALSGTPIKNNAGEYFTILNILQPTRFPTYQGYLDRYCHNYNSFYSTKVGGLTNPEEFREDTKDFIIRRTRAEAAPEIPVVDRQFFHVELDKKLNKAYAAAMEELEELFYKDEDDSTTTSMIAIMTKMRKIAGISKIPACVDAVIEHLENESSKKLVVFAHHHDVVNGVEIRLNTWLAQNNYSNLLNLNANLDADKRARLVEKFEHEKTARVMIASTLAAGEGLNLQFCSRAIMLERQWNPANEEQAEGRFARIGQADNIVVTYMLASETIDEYFTDIVESKRAIIKNTLDGENYQWDQSSLVKELASILVSKGKKKWSL